MAMSRTQRCGHCEGCLAKACGTCVYCKDNPQFGGPGVKKQSCVARRCTRVLEGKLQREATGLRAKTGCGYCEECRQSDCGVCLVCMDKRFFRGKFLPNALCAKKKCSNARSLDASPRHSPSPKHTSFKTKNDNSHVNNSSSSNSSSTSGLLIRKRLMVGDSGGGGAANNVSKKSKKSSDPGVPLAQHPSTYNNPFSAHSTFSRNGSESVNGSDRIFTARPSYPHLAAPAAHPPTAQMQQTGYNGSPPAGTVAPATSVQSEFSPYLQTAAHGGAPQAPPSYQLAAVSLPSATSSSSSQEMYNLYCSFPPVAGNRLTAGHHSSSSSSQPLQPPPYQWPSTKMLFPSTALDQMMTSTQQHHHHHANPNIINAAVDGGNHHHNHHHSTVYGEHPMLRDRLSNSVVSASVHNNNQSSDDQDNVQLQHKLMQFYRSDKSHPYYNHHMNTVHQTLPGSIVTEPMGPMGQPKVILQQL